MLATHLRCLHGDEEPGKLPKEVMQRIGVEVWPVDTVQFSNHPGYGEWRGDVFSGEAIRLALKRLGIRWRRAKHWITSPDPAYARKKKPATA